MEFFCNTVNNENTKAILKIFRKYKKRGRYLKSIVSFKIRYPYKYMHNS